MAFVAPNDRAVSGTGRGLTRRALFPAALAAVLLVFHGVYTMRGMPPPALGYRTVFADVGYVLRYLAGQTPAEVIASRRDGRLHLFHRGELALQTGDSGRDAGRRLVAALRPAIDRLASAGAVVVPVIVPTKLSLYRELLPFRIDAPGLWTREPGGGADDPQAVHEVIAAAVPEAVDLFETFREFRRQSPERLLYPPLDYHWTSLGSATAVTVLARSLIERRLLTAAPQVLPLGPRRLGASYLTDQYPLPHWYVDSGREFRAEEEVVRFAHNTQDQGRRTVLLGTSFSGGAPEQFAGQLRSVLGGEIVSFVRPDNGLAGGYRMMRQSGFEVRRGDLVIWELPLCCLNLDGPGLDQ